MARLLTNYQRVAWQASVGALILWAAGDGAAIVAKPQASATIHWERVPLRDAVARLESVFDDRVFVDRRVDPSQRVSLDIEATCARDVLAPIADARELGVAELGGLIYFGPRDSAARISAVVALRTVEIEKLPAKERAALERAQPRRWARFAEPRELITALVEEQGWKVEGAQLIPHDLWAAGGLPELSLAEQLTVLLIGFDLTFEVRPREHSLEIVRLDAAMLPPAGGEAKPSMEAAEAVADAARKENNRHARGTKQVYTLRVAEQPVRAVLQELSRRLKWEIEIDDVAIAAAGRTADARVSFAVENAEQDELLDALLEPAGLSFRRNGDKIVIVPRGTE